MRKFHWLIALLCVFSLVAAACGDDDIAVETMTAGTTAASRESRAPKMKV